MGKKRITKVERWNHMSASLMRITFPQGFVWGVASSSYQTEGGWNEDGKGESIWDRFSHTPGKIKNGDTGDVACDHYHRYAEDVALMRELGVQAYRFSISWPRVLPNGKGKVNKAGLNFYSRLVDELLESRIEPWACLYHYDLPQALQEKGGWANRDIVQYFADYAGLMARTLGNRVKRWLILNEPRPIAWSGHLAGTHAPGIKNLEIALKVSHNLQLAQGKAIQTLRDSDRSLQIGTIIDLNVVHPISDDKKNQMAANNLDQFQNRWYIDPLLKGEYPPLAAKIGLKPNQKDMDLIKQPLDFLGVNYYTRSLAAYDPSNAVTQAKAVWKNTPTTERGWEIYPDGLYEVLMRLRMDYGDPLLYVTENGVAFKDNVMKDGEVQDDDRIVFLRDHIAAVHRAMRDGVRLKGYFVWTIMDNFEWAEGYSKRFGLIQTNYKSLKRTPKKSFYWYKQLIANNGFAF
jgi:beta-glucosidase